LINKFDSEVETIEKIVFHKEDSENYRIRVKFKNEIEEIDAFKRLSEGHVRALGLSMMLAVAEKEDKPFLIFDDVVNAIDSDHRANIIEMIFTEPVLRNKQLIITTHDRLFWERFCNYDNSKSNYLSYIFDCQEHIGVFHTIYDGSFSIKIKNALEVCDIRQALIYCRIWFETMVTDYCLKNKVKVLAGFTESKKERNNLIRIDLEHMYREVKSLISGSFDFTETYNAIYGKNSSNWQGMNQENHSLDDNNLNFSHSKTSREITDIYENIKKLELILFPEKVKRKIEDIEKDISIKSQRLMKIDSHLLNQSFQTSNPTGFEKMRTEKVSIENEVLKLENEMVVLTEHLPKQESLV
jgi:DNA sulfur modification protein DndD